MFLLVVDLRNKKIQTKATIFLMQVKRLFLFKNLFFYLFFWLLLSLVYIQMDFILGRHFTKKKKKNICSTQSVRFSMYFIWEGPIQGNMLIYSEEQLHISHFMQKVKGGKTKLLQLKFTLYFFSKLMCHQ